MLKTIFGTDGIRAPVGHEPLTIIHLIKMGYAIGAWACKYYNHAPSILIGCDTRESADFVNAALKTGLLLHGSTIHDAGIAPTPAICQLVNANTLFDMGIIVSASHNPYHDNGIKIVAHSGKLTAFDEQQISSIFHQTDLAHTNYNNFGTTIPWAFEELYIKHINSFFSDHFLKGKKIILDCAHGATHHIAPKIFKQFGAALIAIHNTPNGKNINDQCGALHLTSLQKAVIEHHADIGFAFDGDGDRVIAVNKYGVIKDGDDILALLLEHPLYKEEKNIVGTIMTNQGFAAYIEKKGKKLIRTIVGDKHVAEHLEKNSLLIGGEQSGHIILRDYLATGDGIFTALRMLQALEYADNWDMTTFEKFPQLIINIPIKEKKDLSHAPLSDLIAKYESKLINGRLIVRYSGTEAILRVMVEDENLDHVYHIGENLSKELEKKLSL